MIFQSSITLVASIVSHKRLFGHFGLQRMATTLKCLLNQRKLPEAHLSVLEHVMGEQYSYYPLTYTRAKGIFPAYRQGAGLAPCGKVATARRLLSVWMDGRAVPLLTVSPARRVKWQQRQGFSIAKESTLPCEHTAPYARSACSGR